MLEMYREHKKEAWENGTVSMILADKKGPERPNDSMDQQLLLREVGLHITDIGWSYFPFWNFSGT